MHVDTASTAERLALKGASFMTTDKVAAAMREGVATELADAIMAALGSCFECLSDEDVHILQQRWPMLSWSCKARLFLSSESMAHHIRL